MAPRDTLVWIDLEMTGLDPERDRILEIATIVTDDALNILAEGPVFAIRQDEAVLAAMDDWNRSHHGASGLLDRVRHSVTDEATAERLTIAFLSKWSEPGSSPMCGNSVGQDRRFLSRHMRSLEVFFHYRNIDVSTVKELARRWRPDVLAGVQKRGTHQALDDIRESVAELQHYRDTFFRLS